MISLFAAATSLAFAPCLLAQTTLEQQQHSARVLSDGTLETGQSWVSVTHTPGSAIYDLNFTNPFTAKPNCVISADAVAGNGDRFAEVHAPLDAAQSLNRIQVFTSVQTASGIIGSLDASFTIHCSPDSNVGVSAASWNAGGALLSGTDWATMTPLSPGRYLLTFSRPYLSTPNCVATSGAVNLGEIIQVNATTTNARIYIQTIAPDIFGILQRTETNKHGSIICSGPQ
jgi:hypothetical protein